MAGKGAAKLDRARGDRRISSTPSHDSAGGWSFPSAVAPVVTPPVCIPACGNLRRQAGALQDSLFWRLLSGHQHTAGSCTVCKSWRNRHAAHLVALLPCCPVASLPCCAAHRASVIISSLPASPWRAGRPCLAPGLPSAAPSPLKARSRSPPPHAPRSGCKSFEETASCRYALCCARCLMEQPAAVHGSRGARVHPRLTVVTTLEGRHNTSIPADHSIISVACTVEPAPMPLLCLQTADVWPHRDISVPTAHTAALLRQALHPRIMWISCGTADHPRDLPPFTDLIHGLVTPFTRVVSP
jgi:hypothetical protein